MQRCISPCSNHKILANKIRYDCNEEPMERHWSNYWKLRNHGCNITLLLDYTELFWSAYHTCHTLNCLIRPIKFLACGKAVIIHVVHVHLSIAWDQQCRLSGVKRWSFRTGFWFNQVRLTKQVSRLNHKLMNNLMEDVCVINSHLRCGFESFPLSWDTWK